MCVVYVQVDNEAVRKLKRVDAAAISKQEKLSEMDIEAVVKNDSTYLKVFNRLISGTACSF